jgi:hypothetical protein
MFDIPPEMFGWLTAALVAVGFIGLVAMIAHWLHR